VADDVIAAMRDERFLVLPHPGVLKYLQRKSSHVDCGLGATRTMPSWAEQAWAFAQQLNN